MNTMEFCCFMFIGFGYKKGVSPQEIVPSDLLTLATHGQNGSLLGKEATYANKIMHNWFLSFQNLKKKKVNIEIMLCWV